MNIRVLVRAMFVVWALAVAALSVISYPLYPGGKDLLVSVKVTSSGFVVHCIAYFMGIFLCYFSFNKKNISFVVWAGLLIFLYSVVLEVVQFYLPSRAFNVYDVVGNGTGILFFVVFISHPNEIEKKKAFHRAGRPTQTDTPEEYATHSTGQADFCPADPAGQK